MQIYTHFSTTLIIYTHISQSIISNLSLEPPNTQIHRKLIRYLYGSKATCRTTTDHGRPQTRSVKITIHRTAVRTGVSSPDAYIEWQKWPWVGALYRGNFAYLPGACNFIFRTFVLSYLLFLRLVHYSLFFIHYNFFLLQ